MEIDHTDTKILAALQADSSLSVARLAEISDTSEPTCYRRLKRLEQLGVIKSRVTLVDQALVNLSMTGFILVRTSNHNDKWLKKFSEGIQRIPEVLEFHRMTGDIDYLLKIVAPDLIGYDRIYKQLIKVAELSDVTASFSMECLKYTTQLPLHYAEKK